MDATTHFDTQIIGALPVIVNYFERLRLGAIINEVVPWEGDVPLGTVVEIMIANRLLSPDVPGKARAHGRAVVHLGVGIDGHGLDGASDPSKLERQADVRAVPREPSQPGTHRPGDPQMFQHSLHCDRERTRRGLATFG